MPWHTGFLSVRLILPGKRLSRCCDVISVQQMSMIVWIFLSVHLHVLWVPFYMQVKALGIVPQEPCIFVCMCGRCIFCVPACMTAYMCASTRRSHRSTLGTGLSPGLDDWVRRGVRPAPEVLPVHSQCWNYKHAPL